MNTTAGELDPSVMRTLVTGGAGFIGSHLVEQLLARGDEVTVIDDLSTGRAENLPGAGHGVANLRFIEADLSRALEALTGRERFDQIYHLAAAVGVARVLDNPIECIETNVGQTSAVLRFALDHGRNPGRPASVLVASSSEVYGKSDRVPFAEEDDCVYGPTTAWRWSYAASKAVDEYLALAYWRQHQMPTVVARLFNTVGPRQVGDYGMVLPRFIHAALREEPLVVFGDGSQTRCFCDVRDVVPALIRLLGTADCAGRVFNVGSDRPISIADLADRVIAVLDSRSEVRRMPYDEVYSEGFEDPRRREPSLARTRLVIGFEPNILIDDTIRATAKWIRDNQ
ncbi:MAG: NAD-dependent epimerase/dehydratase family protein [Phycisphaerales bacterium]|nr:NAD-dependent epimerase/dehydratase family protein [Phycisphaerales bacterium]MCA9306075.1 NAD-dependent epimerase/dehydratase family protein [Phycisphaerales bacterium]